MSRLGDDAQTRVFSLRFLHFLHAFYLLASGPAASSPAPVVTLGGLSSSQRDMASSVEVALFKRRSIVAMRVSNGALGIYRVAAVPAVCVHCQGSRAPGSEKGRRGGGRPAWKRSLVPGSNITERRIKSCSTSTGKGHQRVQIM